MSFAKLKMRVTHNGHVLFSGSEAAWGAWFASHWLPPAAEVTEHDQPIGPNGAGCGRELIGYVDTVMGGGSNVLPKCPNGCHSARAGYP